MSDYTPTGAPADQTRGASATIRSEFQAVATAIATKADTAGETYSGAHDFSAATGVTLPAATSVGNVSATELSYLGGVTSAIQTQLGTKSAKAGETYSGTHDFSGATSVAVPAPSSGAHAVTKTFVEALAFSAALPLQAGNAGKFVTTDGTSASWATLSTGASLSGATTLDLTSGNATLTSASDQVQTITAAVSGRAINLPDSTSMTEGGFPFIIINKTGHSVALKNSSGTVVRVVGGGVVSLCAITDAATNAWACYQFANEMVVNLGAVFNSGSLQHTSIAMLDSSTAIVCYTDVGNSSYGTAQILRIDGSTIIAGQSYETVFSSASTSHVSVVAIDSTHALVTYAISGYGKAMVLTVSGISISTNTAATFSSAQTSYGKVALLDSTHAIVAYRDDSVTYGKACVLSVSGTSISPGAPATFVSANTGDLGLAVLDSTHAIVTYADGGASSYGKARVLSVSGTSISPGAPATFEAASSSEPHVATLSASKAVVAYKVGGGVSYNKTCVLDVSGTSVLPGASVTLNSGSNAGQYFSIAAMASDRAVLAYSHYEVGVNYGVAQMLNISGTMVVPGALTVFRNAAVAYLGITAMDSGKVVVTYQDAGLSSYGVASVLSNL